MKTLLALAAVSEAATGLVLLVYPSIVVSLLFGSEITGAGIVMSRLAGISLIAFVPRSPFPASEKLGPCRLLLRKSSR